MSADARATLEQSKEGKHFLDLVAKCSDKDLIPALIAAGARLLTVTGKENVPSQAGTSPDLSSAFLCIKNLSFINPRGKFDITFTKEAIVLCNSKSNIVVPTSAVTHVAILDQIPQDTKKRCLLFIVLNKSGPAVMNGKQRLDAAIIQTLESDITSTVATSGEVLEGPTVAVLCQAVGMSIPNFSNFLAPDPEVFKTSRGHIAVSAVVKVSQGHLFPLPGALLFAERPALFLPLSDVMAVEYRRAQSATFDLVLHTRAREGEGGSAGESIQQVEFSQVDRGELGRLQSYFAASKVKLYDPAAPPRPGGGSSTAGAGGLTSGVAGDDGDDEDGEDEDEDEDFDPSSLQRQEARRRPSKKARTGPSTSASQADQPGGSGAGPSGSRVAGAEEWVAASSDEDEEGEEEGEDDEDEDEDEDSYDEDEELADLTDEDDLAADAVRKRVQGAGGSEARGGGLAVAAAAGSKGGRTAGKRGRAESDEDADDDDDDQ